MKKLMGFRSICLFAALIFGLALPAAAQPPVNLSGYEFRLGTPCTINGDAGKCGVQFGGWTGGSGQEADGWTPFPGNKQGLWKAEVNYTGSPDFGATVDLKSGSFDLFLKHRLPVSGTVTGGMVEWPADETDGSLGCGPGVAKVTVFLSIGGSPHEFDGCLHDLPAGTIIPPTIWGALQ